MAEPFSKDGIQAEALELIRREKTAWETETVFVTERVAVNVRNLIRQCRKNYWGVFDNPKDEVTGYDKLFVPMTEIFVEDSVKNADLDQKDININARKRTGAGFAHIIRNYTRISLDAMRFGAKLDDVIRRAAIDGTAVWKTLERKNPVTGKSEPYIKPIDLLNIYVDPTIESLQDEDAAIIERGLLTEGEFNGMKAWINKDQAKATTSAIRSDADSYGKANTLGARMVEVYERWGLIPKYFITGNRSDTEQVPGHIVASGGRNAWVLHYIEENRKGIKPYEELFWTKVPGRWYGRGVAEKLMFLQIYLNTVINIRIARSRVSQLGIFKVRKGSGISQQSFSRLAANGVIQVNNIDDIQQFVMQEASQASYNDEANIMSIARRVTAIYETVTGETLPSSATATGSSIATSAAQLTFSLIRDGIADFLKRWVKRHYFPIMAQNLTKEVALRIADDEEELRDYDEYVANALMAADAEAYGIAPEKADALRMQIMDKLKSTRGLRYVGDAEALKDIDFSDYDVEVSVTDEQINSAVIQQRLIEALKVAPEYKDLIIPQLFDLMGLYFKKPEAPAMQPGMAPGMPAPQGMPLPNQMPDPNIMNMQQVATQANTLNR